MKIEGAVLTVQYEYVGRENSDAILWWEERGHKQWYRKTLSCGMVLWLDKYTIDNSASVRCLMSCQKLVPYGTVREYDVKWRIQ